MCHCPVMSCQESVRATSHRKCVPSGRSQPASAGVARATLLPGVELPWDCVVLGVPISVQARRCSSVQRWKSLVQSSAGGLPRRRRWIDTALGEMPGDDHSLDLVGALEDLHDSGPSGSLPGQQPAWPRGISRDSARAVRRLVVAASGGRAGLTSSSPTQASSSPQATRRTTTTMRTVRCCAQRLGAVPHLVTPCQAGQGGQGLPASYALFSGSFMATIRKSAPSSAPDPSEHSCPGHRASGYRYDGSLPGPVRTRAGSMASYMLAGTKRVGP